MGALQTLAGVMFFVCAPTAAATTWYVDANGTSPGSGRPADPYQSLAYALAHRNTVDGDTILVAPGSYLEEIDFSGKAVTVRSTNGAGSTFISPGPKSIDFYGFRAPQEHMIILRDSGPGDAAIIGFTITGGNKYDLWLSPIVVMESRLRIVDCEIRNLFRTPLAVMDSHLVVQNCNFRNNHGSPYFGVSHLFHGTIEAAGAISAMRSTLEISQSTFSVCNVYGTPLVPSGALCAVDCDVRITDCAFVGNDNFTPNLGNYAGGAVHAGGSVVRIEHSLFRDNHRWERSGGALSLSTCHTVINECQFLGNTAHHRTGGAVAAWEGKLEVRDCEFRGNECAEGGAVSLFGIVASFDDCVFADNGTYPAYTELGRGGAVLAEINPDVTIRNSLLLRNKARSNFPKPPAEGGAVFGPVRLVQCTLTENGAWKAWWGRSTTFGGAVSGGATLDHCIAWNNRPASFAPGTQARFTCVEGGWPGTGNIAGDPRFVDPEAEDFSLAQVPAQAHGTSPCVDAGNPGAPAPAGSTRSDGGFDTGRADLGYHHVGCSWEFGQGCAGAGGYTPALTIDGCPAANDAADLRVVFGLGGAAALIVASPNAISTPLGGGCSLLVQPQSVIPVVLTAGSAGQGTALLPDLVAFGGVNPLLQVVVIDPTTATGVAASRGFGVRNTPASP